MSKTILTVDDSASIRQMGSLTLAGAGYRVLQAANGSEGYDAAVSGEPDAVITDLNMPVMNGIEFLKALRREFGPDNPPVLFCTTENDISFIEQAIEHGAQEYIMKPFDSDILMGKFAQVGLA